MADWRSIIKEKVDAYNSIEKEITDELYSLVKSIEVHPYNFGTILATAESDELSWDVTIANRTINITRKEIANARKRYPDDSGTSAPLKEKGDLRQTLIDIMLQKFDWSE